MTGALNASALIVGIDDYSNIARLSGCTRDAVDFADWLIGIGVPRHRIRLNIAPSSDSATVDAPDGVVLGGASRADIWRSIVNIGAETGDWLFVLWSGHGYYLVEQRGPIFLTQEWDPESNTSMNLDVVEFADYFQSFRFKSQFLVVDACQNYPQDSVFRSRIKATGANVGGWSPINSNAVALCCAVSQEEIAPLIDGRGIFTRRILDALKAAEEGHLPAHVSDVITFDWRSGARKINLQPLFNNFIRPAVVEEAAQAGRTQTPTLQPRGAATGKSAFFIRDLPSAPIADLEVEAHPATAVKLIRVMLNPVVSELRLPSRDGAIPFKGKTLIDARLAAYCIPKAGWVAKPPYIVKDPVLPSQVKVCFDLSQPPPDLETGAFNIRVVGPDGGPAPSITPEDYRDINIDPDNPPPDVHTHEYGPDVNVTGDGHAARTMARRLEVSLRKRLARTRPGDDVFVAPPGHPVEATRPNLRIDLPAGGAAWIAGYLTDAPNVRIERVGGGAKGVLGPFSLNEIAAQRLRRVDPGLYRVRVDAPWGSSLTQVEVGPNALGRCTLDRPVGRIPLRNAIATDGVELRSPFTVIPDAEGASPLARSPEQEPEQALERDNLYVPTIGGISVLIQKAWAAWRAEPYSRLPLVEWDMLIGAGRLQDVDVELAIKAIEANSTDSPPIERDLLRLALAYASRAQGKLDVLDTLLKALETQSAKMTTDARALWLYAQGTDALPPLPPPLFRWGETLVSARTPDTDFVGGAITSSVWAVYQRLEKPDPTDILLLKTGGPGIHQVAVARASA